MNEPLQSLFDLLLEHCFKFDYTAKSCPKINKIYLKCICDEVDEDTFELKSLLEKSLQDGVDYLPEKYHYKAENFIGDPNADLIN